MAVPLRSRTLAASGRGQTQVNDRLTVGRAFGALVLAVALFPGGATGQTNGQAFEDLPGMLKPGQMITVTDSTGRKISGKVAEISPDALVLLTKERAADGTRREAWTGRQTFLKPSVQEVRTRDLWWDGALIAYAIGVIPVGLAASKAGSGAFPAFLAVSGTWAGVGFGIDAAVSAARLYRAAPTRTGITVSPMIGEERKGVRLAWRF
jgi:hypothetical protein